MFGRNKKTSAKNKTTSEAQNCSGCGSSRTTKNSSSSKSRTSCKKSSSTRG